MSTESGPGQAMATMPCPVCGKRVAAGAFCARCGACLFPQRGEWPEWLRIRAYDAAPGEHVLRLSVVSSLFPRLPRHFVRAFRVGLAALLLVLVAFAVLRWQPPLIAISTVGLPLVFLSYLRLSDVYHDLPVRTLVVTALLAVGLGVGWALLTSPVIAHSYDVTLLSGMTGGRAQWQRVAIPLAGAVLMLVPVVLTRMSRPAIRESLDGFVIGSLGAISFTAAATLTRLAPQLATGVVAHDRPIGSLLVEAAIQGLALPLTAAAVGGMAGTALWFRRRADISQPQRWHMLPAHLPEFGVVLIVYTGLGLIDVARLPQGLHFGLYLVMTVFALLALRVVLQAALLREEHELGSGAPMLCANCDHVVPDMAFCPNCGVAASASSRSSRTTRRLNDNRVFIRGQWPPGSLAGG
jgi:uncharacterized membrane protein